MTYAFIRTPLLQTHGRENYIYGKVNVYKSKSTFLTNTMLSEGFIFTFRWINKSVYHIFLNGYAERIIGLKKKGRIKEDIYILTPCWPFLEIRIPNRGYRFPGVFFRPEAASKTRY